MASGLNHCMFIGNLGADPEVRYTANGAAICEIRVAVTESWKDKTTNERQERTEWVRCTFFGKLGELVGEYTKKGSSVCVIGKMRTDEYVDKEGIKRWATKIIGDECKFLSQPPGERSQSRAESDRKPQEGRGSTTREPAPARGQPTPAAGRPHDGFEDDDIPF